MEQGLDTLVGPEGHRLSGGQAQRLALARTLYHKRPVLILDDPFSALDKPTEAEIFRQLRILAKDSIVLLISHRLYLFPQLDRVLWMENGTVTAGTQSQTVTLDSLIYGSSNGFGGMGGPGGQGGFGGGNGFSGGQNSGGSSGGPSGDGSTPPTPPQQ